jgi:hypothetical protein
MRDAFRATSASMTARPTAPSPKTAAVAPSCTLAVLYTAPQPVATPQPRRQICMHPEVAGKWRNLHLRGRNLHPRGRNMHPRGRCEGSGQRASAWALALWSCRRACSGKKKNYNRTQLPARPASQSTKSAHRLALRGVSSETGARGRAAAAETRKHTETHAHANCEVLRPPIQSPLHCPGTQSPSPVNTRTRCQHAPCVRTTCMPTMHATRLRTQLCRMKYGRTHCGLHSCERLPHPGGVP